MSLFKIYVDATDDNVVSLVCISWEISEIFGREERERNDQMIKDTKVDFQCSYALNKTLKYRLKVDAHFYVL